jgi:hypothetical protein
MISYKKVDLKSKLFKECKASWWVGVFVLFTYMLALKTYPVKEEQIIKLSQQLNCLQSEKALALHAKDELSLQIESQEDPLWIERVLIKKLGVVPEGQIKVRFKKEGGIAAYSDGL